MVRMRTVNEEWVNLPGFPKRRGYADIKKGLARTVGAKPKPVRIVETGKIFNSVTECAGYFQVKPSNISRVLIGERKGQKFHGYHLEYAEKEVM